MKKHTKVLLLYICLILYACLLDVSHQQQAVSTTEDEQGPVNKQEHFDQQKELKRKQIEDKNSLYEKIKDRAWIVFTYIDYFGLIRKDFNLICQARDYIHSFPYINMLPNWYMNLCSWYCLFIPQLLTLTYICAWIFWNVLNPTFHFVHDNTVDQPNKDAQKIKEHNLQQKQQEKESKKNK